MDLVDLAAVLSLSKLRLKIQVAYRFKEYANEPMPLKKTPRYRRGFNTREFIVQEDGSIRRTKRKWVPWAKEHEAEDKSNTEESQDPSVQPPVTDVDCSNSYELNRDRCISGWDSVRQQLLSAFIEEQAPPTGSCQLCIAPATSRCLDCGPGTKFCSGCLQDVHANNVLHLPEVIVVSLYVNDIHCLKQNGSRFHTIK